LEDENEDDINLLKMELKKSFLLPKWDEEAMDMVQSLQKRISKANEKNLLKVFLDIKKIDLIYIPFFFDFRGRKYYFSEIGHTFFKFARFAFHYGINNEKIESHICIKDEYKEIIRSFFKKKKIILKEEMMEIYFFYLVSLGKFSLNRLKIQPLPISQLLEDGIANLNIDELVDNEDNIEFLYYKFS
jgi:hypothetical protein